MRSEQWSEPREVDDVLFAFPAIVTGKLLPPIEDVPAEFRQWHNPWGQLVSRWFYKGLDGIQFRDGIDGEKALRQLSACMRSFEPKHEHKTAGVAWLMSMWCEPSMVEEAPR